MIVKELRKGAQKRPRAGEHQNRRLAVHTVSFDLTIQVVARDGPELRMP